MTTWFYTKRIAILAALLWPVVAETSFAQRGEGRGGGGQGRSGASGGGGGQGRSMSRGGGGGRQGRSFSGGAGRSSAGRGSVQRSMQGQRSLQGQRTIQGQRFSQGGERSMLRGDGQQRTSPGFSSQPSDGRATQQRSFYRGPQTGQGDIRQFDRGQFDRSQDFSGRSRDLQSRQLDSQLDAQRQRDARDRFSDRGQREGFEDRTRDRIRDRDGQQFGEDSRNRDWRDRVFSDERADRRIDADGRFDDDRDRFSRRRDDWRRTADRIRFDWRGRDRRDVPFRFGWWNNYASIGWPVYSPWRYSWWRDRPYYWWGYTPAPRLTNWLVFGWNRPYYWDYGPGANIYYQDDYVYYDNQRYLPVNEYYQQVHDLAHSVPAIDESAAGQMEWTPLGVFAATREGQPDDYRTLQLAVNKNGVISGTYFNPRTNQVFPVEGMVDDRTQRAAWTLADGSNDAIVFETSIYNLTESQSTMMVHFGPQADQTEVWQLVRLEQPDAAGGEVTTEPTTIRNTLP